MSKKNLLLEQKMGENTEINPAKIVTEVNCDVLTVILSEHVKFLRQQYSWLNQRKSDMIRAESVFFRNDHTENQLFSELFQHCSEFIRLFRQSGITSQV